MQRFASTLAVLVVCSSPRFASAAEDFDVTFNQCVEYVGIGAIPAAQARARVPAAYALAGDGTKAVVVVRVVDCDAVSVDGKPGQTGLTAQVGVMLAGVDPTADINNYLLWFATDLGVLNGKFQAAGIDCTIDQGLSLSAENSGLAIDVNAPNAAGYQIEGQVTPPSAQPVGFVANWWFDGKHGTVRMRTVFPEIRFGAASATLTTAPNSQLAALIGGTSLTFAFLDSYNDFVTAQLQARLQ